MTPRGHVIRTADYLLHILNAIDRIAGYVSKIDDAVSLEKEWMAQDAVIRQIEIIGEAANKIAKSDPAFIGLHSEIAWDGIRGMRNKVIHDYFEVDIGLVWVVVRYELPKLASQIKAILASIPDRDS